MAASGPQPAELLEPLRTDPQRSAILCDIDGTLAPISALPGDAKVPEETRAVLRDLAGRYAVVGCLSGRRAAEARSMVGVQELAYVGNHGLEVLRPDDEEARIDPAVEAQADRAREFIATLDPGRLSALGLRCEDKGPIQSLHWRGAPREADAQHEAEEIAGRAAETGLEPRWGRKVVELRPRARIDKGSAIARLVGEHRAARALYGGDDVTDLDAFRALRRMREEGALEHAVCVGVASDEEPPSLRDESDLVVAGTEGYLDVLRALA